MPAGLLVTTPTPVPFLDTLNWYVNVAVTDLATLIVTVQAPDPLHAPPQPAKDAVASGVAVRSTTVPLSKLAEH